MIKYYIVKRSIFYVQQDCQKMTPIYFFVSISIIWFLCFYYFISLFLLYLIYNSLLPWLLWISFQTDPSGWCMFPPRIPGSLWSREQGRRGRADRCSTSIGRADSGGVYITHVISDNYYHVLRLQLQYNYIDPLGSLLN